MGDGTADDHPVVGPSSIGPGRSLRTRAGRREGFSSGLLQSFQNGAAEKPGQVQEDQRTDSLLTKEENSDYEEGESDVGSLESSRRSSLDVAEHLARGAAIAAALGGGVATNGEAYNAAFDAAYAAVQAVRLEGVGVKYEQGFVPAKEYLDKYSDYFDAKKKRIAKADKDERLLENTVNEIFSATHATINMARIDSQMEELKQANKRFWVAFLEKDHHIEQQQDWLVLLDESGIFMKADAMKENIAQLQAQGKIQLFQESPGEDIPRHLQGDIYMYTFNTVLDREIRKFDVNILAVISKWWEAASKTSGQPTRIMKEEYAQIFTLVTAVLVPEIFDKVDQIIEADWVTDSDDNGLGLTFVQFHKCLFHLADTWTDTLSVREYVSFLNRLLLRITRVVDYETKRAAIEDQRRGTGFQVEERELVRLNKKKAHRIFCSIHDFLLSIPSDECSPSLLKAREQVASEEVSQIESQTASEESAMSPPEVQIESAPRNPGFNQSVQERQPKTPQKVNSSVQPQLSPTTAQPASSTPTVQEAAEKPPQPPIKVNEQINDGRTEAPFSSKAVVKQMSQKQDRAGKSLKSSTDAPGNTDPDDEAVKEKLDPAAVIKQIPSSPVQIPVSLKRPSARKTVAKPDPLFINDGAQSTVIGEQKGGGKTGNETSNGGSWKTGTEVSRSEPSEYLAKIHEKLVLEPPSRLIATSFDSPTLRTKSRVEKSPKNYARQSFINSAVSYYLDQLRSSLRKGLPSFAERLRLLHHSAMKRSEEGNKLSTQLQQRSQRLHRRQSTRKDQFAVTKAAIESWKSQFDSTSFAQVLEQKRDRTAKMQAARDELLNQSLDGIDIEMDQEFLVQLGLIFDKSTGKVELLESPFARTAKVNTTEVKGPRLNTRRSALNVAANSLIQRRATIQQRHRESVSMGQSKGLLAQLHGLDLALDQIVSQLEEESDSSSSDTDESDESLTESTVQHCLFVTDPFGAYT